MVGRQPSFARTATTLTMAAIGPDEEARWERPDEKLISYEYSEQWRRVWLC
jgi:hypothetical protein